MAFKAKTPASGKLAGASKIKTLWRKFTNAVTHPSIGFWLAFAGALALWIAGNAWAQNCTDKFAKPSPNLRNRLQDRASSAERNFALTTHSRPIQIWIGAGFDGTMAASTAMLCPVCRNTFSEAAQTAAVSAVLSCPNSEAGRSSSMASPKGCGQGAALRERAGVASDTLRTPCPLYASRIAQGGFFKVPEGA